MAETLVTIENLLDKIADTIISNPNIKDLLCNNFVKDNQKTIRDGLMLCIKQ